VQIVDVYRVVNEFKKAYQPRTKIIKDWKGDLITNSHSILARCRKQSSQLLNIRVYGVRDVRQNEIHTAQSLLPEPSALEVEMATEELKRHE
jgi:hypothetical protein